MKNRQLIRKTINKIILFINTVAILTVIIFGSWNGVVSYASESDELSGEITVLFNLGYDTMKPYIDNFQQKYPNVTVNYECVSDYENVMQARLESGDYGDVLYVPGFLESDQITSYFAPIGNYYRLAEKYNYLDSAYVSANIVYTIPSSAYAMGIAYNGNVFYNAGISELPQSIDEFLEDLSLIMERTDATPIYLGTDTDWIIRNWIDFPYLEMTGNVDYKGNDFVYEKNPFTEGGTFYDVYKLLYNIAANGYCEEEGSALSWEQICSDLNSGKCACVAVGSWALNQIKNSGDNGNSISFMPFPNSINGKQYMTMNTNYSYGISRNSTNRKAAEAFVDFMLDESGYATDYDNISIVKTDWYPETYGDMDDVILAANNAYTGMAYNYYNILWSNGIDPTSADEIRKIISAGRNGESYGNIMKNWNTKWESARPEGMVTKARTDFGQGNALEENENSAANNVESIYVQNYEVEFSDTEKEYIEEKKTLRVGYATNKAPFQYRSDSRIGQLNDEGFSGLAAYICFTIEENSGLEMEYIPYESESDLIEAIRNGEIDMAAGIKNSDLDGIKFSREYIELTNVIVKNENVDTNSLEGSRQAMVEGEIYDLNVVSEYDTLLYSTLSKAVESVNNHESDFTIADYYSAEYYINEAEYTHVSVIPLTDKTKLSFAYASDVDTRLISISNKCIYSLSEENIQFVLIQNMDSRNANITLRRFIETNPLLSLVLGMSMVAIVCMAIFFVSYEKRKSNRKHEIDTKRYQILSQLTDEYVFEYDLKGGIIHFENKFQDKFNFEQNVILSNYNHENEALNVIIENCNIAKDNDSTATDGFELEDAGGKKQWYRMIAYRISDEDGHARHVIGKIMNIQKTMEETKRIQDKADRDALTGIYNRNGFEKNFNSLAPKYGNDSSRVFAILDIDSFKAVNDSLGHVGGDKALQMLADVLSKMESENIIAARYGGDEFMLCMFGLDVDDAAKILESIVKRMDTNINFQGNVHHISISLGAVYSEKHLAFPVLFAEADTVLYSVKAKGKNGYRIINHLDEI